MDVGMRTAETPPRSSRAEAAWDAFRARVAELGGTVLEPDWLGNRMPHRVRCAAGHEAAPSPSNVARGKGICGLCGRRAARATAGLKTWEAFQARVGELGGTVLETAWLGSTVGHRVRCAAGHETTPMPTNVLRGRHICRRCVRVDAAAAWEAFQARVGELGGTVLETAWLGSGVGHRVRCAAGHETTPKPNNVQQGKGICATCARRDPRRAEEEFRAAVGAAGGTVLEGAWLGALTPHRVRCAEGHETAVQPGSVRQGRGICRTCSRRDPRRAEAEFRERVTAAGGTVLETAWLGAAKPHRVRCAAGHEGRPTPNSVQQGGGICAKCAGMEWDVFYVVLDDWAARVKFGITAGDGRRRLATHARDGYRTVLRLMTGLPGDTAPTLERQVLATLRAAGMTPVRGREHFRSCALPVVLSVVDGHAAAPGGMTSLPRATS